MHHCQWHLPWPWAGPPQPRRCRPSPPQGCGGGWRWGATLCNGHVYNRRTQRFQKRNQQIDNIGYILSSLTSGNLRSRGHEEMRCRRDSVLILRPMVPHKRGT
eukprot:1851757-Rhodomonas_salina.1